MHFFLCKRILGLEKSCYQEILFSSLNKKLLHNKTIGLPANCATLLPSFLTSSLVDCAVVYERSQGYCSRLNPVIMEDAQVTGLPLKVVVDKLNLFAPKSLAESWDNVGLLVEPLRPKVIKKILLTNDLTEEVMEEAIELETNLIISYHPPIFAPLKSVTTKTWKERLIAACLENKIALYSPHTSFDSVKGGVNDWLASAFETTEVTPLVPAVNNYDSYLVEVVLPNTAKGLAAANELQSKWSVVKGELDGETDCQTMPDTGVLKLITRCTSPSVTKLVDILNSTGFGSNEDHIKVMKYEKVAIPGHGMGRLCSLKHKLTVEKVVEKVKTLIKRPYVKLALAVGKDINSAVSTIAICAGSGASLLRGVKADLYLTGEMLHHDILDAAHNGTHVILCNHSDSERGFLEPFSNTLANKLLDGKVQVFVSKKDKDPLITV
ncbi:NIF3-like protein 1 [Anabrus simplex]|uniref:NIF3-like protein 1 n=1 Tax=Anabrus simplex TaxID=316456 RepID=UPI0035A38DB1